MAKIEILFTRVLEESTGAQDVQDEMNRLISGVEGEIIGIQVEELQPNKEYKLYVTIK